MERTYMQQKNKERKLRRITRLAKVVTLIILVGIPFTIGLVVGRVTKQVTVTPAYQVKADMIEEYTAPAYIMPDPCELAVVQCPGEPEYNGQLGE